MADENEAVALRRLRWPVRLATRLQYPDPMGPLLLERLSEFQLVRADVQAVGMLTFWAVGALEQTDVGVTHRVFIRWLDILDQTQVVIRQTNLPGGTVRTEIFRVRRVKELGGRKRFVCIEVELERVE